MKKLTLILIFTFFYIYSIAQPVPIKIWDISPTQKQEHEAVIEKILVDEFELDDTTSKFHRVSVKPLFDDQRMESFIAYMLHEDKYSVEIVKVYLTEELKVAKIKHNYEEQPSDFPRPKYKGTCPDESVDMVFSTCETGLPSAVEAVDYASQVAEDNGFEYEILKGSEENIQAIKNWLSCNNLILFGRVGHGYTDGIVLDDGNLTYNYFNNLASDDLDNKDLYFNSCQVHNAPLEPAILDAGVEKFIGGDVNLAVGSSEEVFKCWMSEVITNEASVTQSLTSCEQANYPSTGAHGVSGYGSDYLPENGSDDNTPEPQTPSDDSFVEGVIHFDWSSPIAAQAYRLQVSKSNNGWTAEDGFTASSEPTSNVPVNLSQTGTTYDWDGAEKGQTYYWTLRSWHPDTGPTEYSQPVSFTVENSSLTYCKSKGENVAGEWIASVKIGATANTSGANGGYADFTNTVFYVSQGNSYNIELHPGFSSDSYNESWKVWADFNQDGDFQDENELIFNPSLSSTDVNGNITIPADALTGKTLMRVSMKGDEAQTSCETFQYGEVEDYSINISENGNNSNITVDHPAVVSVDESITFSGTATSDIQYVKVKVGQWEIANEPVSNGTYSFDYAFSSTGQDRDITVTGYNSSDDVVASAESQITVQESDDYNVTISHPSEGTVGEPVAFSGTTTGNIQNVVVSVDGYEIDNVNVTDGSYNFAYTFSSAGNDRNVLVKAFDNGDDVAQATSTIIINKEDGVDENGLGIWLWYLGVTDFSSHSQLANALSDIGVEKIYVKVADGAYDPSTWPEVNDENLVNTYKNAGLDVIAWSYNRPGNEKEQADALYYAAKTGYESFILDVEVEYNGKTTALHTLFQEFEQARQDAIDNGYASSSFKIGCTTWGNPEDQGMHVEIIDQYVDYHMPQTYTEVWDVLDNQEYWIDQTTQEYQDLGCSKPIYHICAAEEGRITSAQIDEYISIAGPNTSIWSVPKAEMHSSIWPVLQNVNWNFYDNYGTTNTGEIAMSKQSQVQVYPNPASSIIHLVKGGKKLKGSDISIYNVAGQCLLNKEIPESGKVDVSALKEGFYVLKVNSLRTSKTLKLMITR
jgi:hypothetical protein